MNHIFIESLYEFKRVRRSILYRVFFLLSILGVIVYQFTFLSRDASVVPARELFRFYMDWPSQALSSAIAFKSAYFFNLIQLLFVACFASGGSRAYTASTKGALDARPQSNVEIVAGCFLGRTLAFTLLNGLSIATTIFLNLLFYPRSFDLWSYFFYWGTLTFPALVFFLGVSSFVTRYVRNRGLSLLLLLLLLGGLTGLGAGFLNGLFDPCARYIPNMFSDFTGHVNLSNYLLQRGIFLLAGLGFVVLSIIPCRRIPNNPFIARNSLVVALVPLLLAGVLAFVYHARYAAPGVMREAYREAYRLHDSRPGTRVTQNDLHLKELPDGGIVVTSRMTVTNVTSGPVPLVMYLNPGLRVKSAEIDGVKTTLRQEHQVLSFGTELLPGVTREVVIDYEGGIGNEVCFLDVPDGQYDSPAVNSHGMYHHGYTPAFCRKDYKLLTPECLWYPVSVPPYSPSACREVNFTRYSLTVEHDPRLKAISQGDIVGEENGRTSFGFSLDIPGISLCIGNYEKRSIMVDRTRVDVCYLPGHEYLLDGYDFPRDKLAEELKNAKSMFDLIYGLIPSHRLTDEEKATVNAMKDDKRKYRELLQEVISRRPFDPTRSYPYPWLMLVEVPCDFDCFPVLMRPTGEREQDGMVFIPEKLHTAKEYRTTPPRDEEERDELLSIFRIQVIEPVLGSGECNILPAFRGRTYFISSAEYPNFHHIFVNMLMKSLNFVSTLDDDSRVIGYLGQNSLRDAFSDNTLSTAELRSIVDKKSVELHQNILSRVKEEDLMAFYERFLTDNVLTEVTEKEYFRQFHQSFGFRIDSLVEKWYNTDRLPVFDICDARAIKVGETNQPMFPDVLYSFRVFNRGDVPGLIMTNDGQGWVIPAREARQIRARKRKGGPISTGQSSIEIPLALNFPSSVFLPLEDLGAGNIDTTTGVFAIDTMAFCTITDEIIVDDADPGFRVVKAKGFDIVSYFRGEKKQFEQYYLRGHRQENWMPAIDIDFHGFPVRSAHCKLAGSGKLKVEWNATLPREGKYEVFYYNVRPNNPETDARREFHYSVFDGKQEHEVMSVVNADESGWTSLGIFHFTGNARVTLSDRDRKEKVVTERGPSPQEIVADAVKWVPVRE